MSDFASRVGCWVSFRFAFDAAYDWLTGQDARRPHASIWCCHLQTLVVVDYTTRKVVFREGFRSITKDKFKYPAESCKHKVPLLSFPVFCQVYDFWPKSSSTVIVRFNIYTVYTSCTIIYNTWKATYLELHSLLITIIASFDYVMVVGNADYYHSKNDKRLSSKPCSLEVDFSI